VSFVHGKIVSSQNLFDDRFQFRDPLGAGWIAPDFGPGSGTIHIGVHAYNRLTGDQRISGSAALEVLRGFADTSPLRCEFVLIRVNSGYFPISDT